MQPELVISWFDAGQGVTKTRHDLQSGATMVQVKAFVDAMGAVSNAGIAYYEVFHLFSDFTPSIASSGPYQSTIDKGQMTYQTANAKPSILSVPAPVTTMFGANKLTVDVTNTAVIALNTAMSAHACDKAGTALAGFESGIRTRGKGKRLRR